jgi:hypothetical protein
LRHYDEHHDLDEHFDHDDDNYVPTGWPLQPRGDSVL